MHSTGFVNHVIRKEICEMLIYRRNRLYSENIPVKKYNMDSHYSVYDGTCASLLSLCNTVVLFDSLDSVANDCVYKASKIYWYVFVKN